MLGFEEREPADGRVVSEIVQQLKEGHGVSLPDSLTDEDFVRVARSTEPPATPSLGGLIDITARSLEGASRVLTHVPELVNSEKYHLPHIAIPRLHILRHTS